MQSQQEADNHQPDHLENASSPQNATTINTGGAASIGGNVNTSGGNFIGRDFNQTIIIQPGVTPEDPQKEQEKYKDNLLLKIINEEEECAQASQVSLHYLSARTGENALVLEAKLAELEKVGLVKHITRSENQRVYEFYSITKAGRFLIINSLHKPC